MIPTSTFSISSVEILNADQADLLSKSYIPKEDVVKIIMSKIRDAANAGRFHYIDNWVWPEGLAEYFRRLGYSVTETVRSGTRVDWKKYNNEDKI